MRSGCKSDSGLSRQEFNKTLLRRFESKCGAVTADGCLPWTATKTSKGYGILQTAGARSRKTTAHRIAWVLAHGDLAPAELVLHRCDNPGCVNAEHLFLGSPQENMDDMLVKGRQKRGDKLDASAVNRIREMRSAGSTQQHVADCLGVSRPLISMIEHGRVQHALQA